MSDNIPHEIQVKIIKELPVKSLIRFRSVCKAWKSLIDSSNFIANYSGRQQHLLVSYEDDSVGLEKKYVSIVDDDTFPQHKVSLTLPHLVNNLRYSSIIGSSHGLLCLDGCYEDGQGGDMAVLWNLSIRKVVAVVLPNMGYGRYSTILGFGVCRETSDPKIVKIRQICKSSDIESITCIPWQVEVFALSTVTWRSPYNNLPRKSIEFSYSHVVLDGFIYWLAVDRIVMGYDDESMSYNLIISFDLTNEEFRDVNLPNYLAHQSYLNLYISKLSNSLVVLESTLEADNPTFTVWIMEDGVPKSFTKLFTIYIPHAGVVSVLEFRKCGEPVIEIIEQEFGGGDERVVESEIVEHHGGTSYYSSLVVYKPYSKCINNLGINGINRSFDGYSYIETLLLLDQPDSSIYDNGKCYISNVKLRREGF